MSQRMSDKWHPLEVKTLISNPWFSVLFQRVKQPDGNNTEYYSIDFPTPAVGVIPKRGEEYLLIRQHRFIIDQFVWAIPSGGARKDETLEQAASRELTEETGFRAHRLEHLLFYYPSYGSSNQRFELFLAQDLEQVTNEFDRNEVIEIAWFKRESIVKMMRDNQIVDGLSLTPLALLFLEEEISKHT